MTQITIGGKSFEATDEQIKQVEKLLKPKKLTYKDIAEKLFLNKSAYIVAWHGVDDCYCERIEDTKSKNILISPQQAKRLLAKIKLENTAYYLNDGEFEPKYTEPAYSICIDRESGNFSTYLWNSYDADVIFFRTIELADQAIEILGEDTIRLALSHDF